MGIDMSNNSMLPRSIAIVSGKGGSGKTMIAAMLAKILIANGHSAVLIDGDIATGGLTYYLGLKSIENISMGLSNIFLDKKNKSDFDYTVKKVIQHFKADEKLAFIGIGDHRRLFKEHKAFDFSGSFCQLLSSLQNYIDTAIIDCRGGIDDDSIAICQAVDEILIVVETDTTSFQATQYLVEILYSKDLSSKIKGFIINKAFDDPSSIARNGTASFRTQFLGAIPFDLSATRKFLVGDISSTKSVFGLQAWAALRKAYGDPISRPEGRVLDFKDFKEITLTNIDSIRGGMLIAFLIISIFPILLFLESQHAISDNNASGIAVILLTVLGLAGGIEPMRKLVGRAVSWYLDSIKRYIFRSSE